jgi:hypothetical protein
MEIKIPKRLEDDIQKLAKELDVNLEDYYKEYMIQLLEELEDIKSIKEFEKNPKPKFVTTKELNKSLGWDDLNDELGLK